MLSINNLVVHYGQIEALHGVSLEVNEDEIVALIGSNGAGKSTLLMSISGLVKSTSGSIEFAGTDVTRMSPNNIVNLGICHVPEGRRIFSSMTVLENLEMGSHLKKNHASFKKNLEKVFYLFPRLKERQKQKGGTLSGGEQQMLAIGRAIMGNPRLLLLDEPSLGLAPVLVDEVYEVIVELQRAGTPILLIEQNAFKALKVANRGYVIETGEIILEDEGHKLLENEQVKQAYLG